MEGNLVAEDDAVLGAENLPARPRMQLPPQVLPSGEPLKQVVTVAMADAATAHTSPYTSGGGPRPVGTGLNCGGLGGRLVLHLPDRS